jgi:hypothetical protein
MDMDLAVAKLNSAAMSRRRKLEANPKEAKKLDKTQVC